MLKDTFKDVVDAKEAKHVKELDSFFYGIVNKFEKKIDKVVKKATKPVDNVEFSAPESFFDLKRVVDTYLNSACDCFKGSAEVEKEQYAVEALKKSAGLKALHEACKKLDYKITFEKGGGFSDDYSPSFVKIDFSKKASYADSIMANFWAEKKKPAAKADKKKKVTVNLVVKS